MKNIKRKLLCIAILAVLICFNSSILSVHADSNISKIEYDCSSIALVDANTGTILAGKNIDQKMQIASIVKLMTLNLLFENIDAGKLSLDDKLVVSEHASSMGGSQLFLDANTSHKIDDLLKSIIVASANDSAVVIAEAIGGSEVNFVKLMNEKAKQLGMTNTYYTDSTGLDSKHYSTASDVAIISKRVLNHPLYQKYSKIWLEEYIHPSGRKTEVANTNRLLRILPNTIAGKTGTTDEAGYCVTNLAQKDDLKLIAVVLGAKTSKDRFTIGYEVLTWGFTNYKNLNIIDSSKPIKVIRNNQAKNEYIEIYAKNDFSIVISKFEDETFDSSIELNKINLPLAAGDTVGKITISIKGKVIGEVDLIIKTDIYKKSVWDNVLDICQNW